MKLFLLLLLCHVSSPVKHSMKVFFTASSGIPESHNFPEVVAVMLIDDVEVGYCDSRIKTALPKQDWMEKLRDGDPKFWKWYTGECTVHQQIFRDEFLSLKKRLNHTGTMFLSASVVYLSPRINWSLFLTHIQYRRERKTHMLYLRKGSLLSRTPFLKLSYSGNFYSNLRTVLSVVRIEEDIVGLVHWLQGHSGCNVRSRIRFNLLVRNLPQCVCGDKLLVLLEAVCLCGVHILQNMFGCEQDEETGDINGFHQYGYNGEDFLVFHLETQTWIAPTPQSVMTKHMWDRDKTRNDVWKNFIHRVCIDCLNKLLDYGRSSLMRTDLPSVSLLQKSPSSPVSCHATGFYPDSAMMFWRKDGEELHEGVDRGEILHNHDGSFQMSSDLDVSSVPPEDWEKYECVFQLSGVKDIFTKVDKAVIRTNWEKPSNMTIPITTAVTGLAVVLMAATGFTVYRKRKADCPPCRPDESSELSKKLNQET